MADTHTCRICGHPSTVSVYTVRERMFGTGDPFDYYQCARCGARQLVRVPRDISRYYPDTYESHRQRTAGRLRNEIRSLRNAAHLRLRFFGAPLAWAVPDASLAAIGRLRPHLGRHHRVL